MDPLKINKCYTLLRCYSVFYFYDSLIANAFSKYNNTHIHSKHTKQQRHNNNKMKRLYFDMLRYHDLCDLFDNKVFDVFVCGLVCAAAAQLYHYRHSNIY